MPYPQLRNFQFNQINAVFWLFVAGIAPIAVLLNYVLGQMGLMMLIALAGSTIALFIHPLVPFSMYFAALFFKDTTVAGLPVSINQLLGPLFLLSVFMYWLKGKTMPAKSWLLPLLSVVTAYFVIRGLTGQDLENGMIYGRYAVVYLLIAVSIAVSLRTEKTILAFAWIVVVTSAAAAIHGLVEAFEMNIFGMFAADWSLAKRIKGAAPNSVVFAWNLLFAFPFAFLLFAESVSKYLRALAILLGALLLGIAVLTFNRQTIMLSGVVVVLCAVLYTYRNRAIFMGIMLSTAAIASITVLPLIVKRMMTVTNLSQDISFLTRRDAFLVGMQMIKDNPIFGIGFGAYSKVWKEYIPPDYSTYLLQYHAPSFEKFMDLGYMSILAETGIIGLLLFVSLVLVILVHASRYRYRAKRTGDSFAQNVSATVIVITLFVAATSAIQDTFLYTRIWIFYGIVMLLDANHLTIQAKTEAEKPLSADTITSDDNSLPQT